MEFNFLLPFEEKELVTHQIIKVLKRRDDSIPKERKDVLRAKSYEEVFAATKHAHKKLKKLGCFQVHFAHYFYRRLRTDPSWVDFKLWPET